MPRLMLAAALLPLLAMAAPADAAQYTVVVSQMKFGPLPKNLQVGDVIVWDNQDLVDHTATARNDSFDVLLPAGKKATQTLEKAGNFAFYCKYHPGMTGDLVVHRKAAGK